jgi:hypothetical protein
VIPRVSISYPRAGRFYITWPLKKGDLVELVFSETSRDNYQAGDGGEVDPDDFRRFDLSDAYALPGACPESKAINDFDSDNLALGVDDGGPTIVIKENGNISVIPSGSGFGHIGADEGAEPIALAIKADTRFTALETYLIGTLVTWANSHQHTYLTPIAPIPSAPILTTVPNVPPLTPIAAGTSVASTKSKAT